MVLSDTIHVMLLTHAKWKTFTTRPIPPPDSSVVSLAISCASKDEVNGFVEAGAAHGGTADVNPPEDHGFMFQRTLMDLDGHLWEPMWMDPAVVSGEGQMPETAA
jgi:predicted lactoylglutathione lyase